MSYNKLDVKREFGSINLVRFSLRRPRCSADELHQIIIFRNLRMLRRIFGYTKPFRRTLVLISALILLMAGLKQVGPFIDQRLTDQLVSGQASFQVIFQFLAVLLGVKILQTFLNRLSWWLTNIFVVKLEIHLKELGFNHLMKLSLEFFNEQASGKVMSNLDRGVNRIINIVNNSGMYFIPNVISALISFVIVLQYEWRIALLTIVGFVPYILINRWRFNKNNILEKKEYRLYDDQYSHFWEVLGSMELIKAFRSENYEKRQLKDFFRKYLQIRQQMESNTNRAIAGDLSLEIMIWSMYAYIVWLTWQGQITIGTLVMLTSLVQLMREPLWQLNWIFWEIKRAQIGAKDFFKIMDVDQQIPEPAKPIKPAQITGQIVFDQVSFTYHHQVKYQPESEAAQLAAADQPPVSKNQTKDLPVFEQVSFKIEPGQMTAFVGPSGAGKTTVASLLMRFFDPDAGRITLDGVDLRDWQKSELRSHLGLVSQDSYLFATTIAENLRYAKPDATIEEMWTACKIAYADLFIKDLPAGLQTEIGERGIKLSGGQRQRLSIARTILSNPEIIILDEATSALDSESELYIQKALAKILKHKTSILIAHRLSTIQQAQKIIVLKDRQVLEQGTHRELLAKDGLYASLFNIQSGQTKLLQEWDLVG